MFGGGGMNPRKMKQMMKQMGIDVDEIDAERVVIETGDGDLVFSEPQVTRMDAQGQQTYQIVGEPDEVVDAGAGDADDADDADAADAAGDADAIPDSDVAIVAERAGVPESEARAALEATDGDLAAAIANLE
ncbi:nascent polypeptide-associated complex protein [Halorubrum vacuolatum]|uniref:Nascent polypeptide-associated complex protein n=1 Tax=Halorubrum vacuolatum TaxID=63740 RepID=A0A238WLW5_HALVU|nr:nascent polypeptide-associated complex protein [Halorubrum vacuolatum]SNR47532.1 Nascent polypeptide associated complex NAC [Halorubrum vacuolatum]